MTKPYPFRQTISLTTTNAKGERIAVYELQVLNLLRGETVNSIVNGSNRFNKAPSLGSEYAMIKVGLTLLQGRLRLSDADFVVESNGQLFDDLHPSVCCTDEYGYPKLDANLIMPGATSEGWIIRFVFKKDPDPLLVMNLTGDRPASEGLFFATTP